MLWRRNRPFRSRRLRAILAQCPDHAPAWAFCPTIFTSSRSPGRASAGRPGTTFRRGPSRTIGPMPITGVELDVFEAWFGDLFDELFGPHR